MSTKAEDVVVIVQEVKQASLFRGEDSRKLDLACKKSIADVRRKPEGKDPT
jgi:hypothetical protein